MRVYEAIAQALVDAGTKNLFGLIGDGNLFFVDHFSSVLGGSYTGVAHESEAVLMALGYAQASGEVGVATVTHGPGLANTVTALIEGVKARVPMVLCAGDTPGIDWEHAQKIDQRTLVAATGAGFEQLRGPSTVADDLGRAFYRANGEHRPIVFNMPVDFQWAETEYSVRQYRISETRSVIPESRDMDEAIGVIASSHKPVVLAGRGVSEGEAEASVMRFAERIDAPLATSLKGKGLFHKDPFNLGICGTASHGLATETIMASDCLVVFGASLNKYTTGNGGLTRGKRIIHVNAFAADIGLACAVTVGMVGDPGLTADAMVDWLDKAEIPGSGARTEELREAIHTRATVPRYIQGIPSPGTVDLRVLLRHINDHVEQDRIFVTDVGWYMLSAWRDIDVTRPRNFIDTSAFTAVGHGLSEAVGAAKAAAGRTVLAIVGDGGFMMGGLSSLAVAVKEKLNILVVICNDDSYGAEYVQFLNRNLDPKITINHWPDLTDLSVGLGARGVTVRSVDELNKALINFRSSTFSGPFVINVHVDPQMTKYYNTID